MDNEAKYGIQMCRFMTYERGKWVTQESIACTLPDQKDKEMYDAMREIKQDAQSKIILENYELDENERLSRIQAKEEEKHKPKCPLCGSTKLYYGSKGTKCKNCGTKI